MVTTIHGGVIIMYNQWFHFMFGFDLNITFDVCVACVGFGHTYIKIGMIQRKLQHSRASYFYDNRIKRKCDWLYDKHINIIAGLPQLFFFSRKTHRLLLIRSALLIIQFTLSTLVVYSRNRNESKFVLLYV